MTQCVIGLEDMRDWYNALDHHSSEGEQRWMIPAVFAPIHPVLQKMTLRFDALEKLYFRSLQKNGGEVDIMVVFQSFAQHIGVSHGELADAVNDLDRFIAQSKRDLGTTAADEGLFLRLSTRSPKDTLLKVTHVPLCIQNGMDVILTLCGSGRVHADVRSSTPLPLIVLRPFVKHLLHWSELRVFVANSRITAASAYMPSDDARLAELLGIGKCETNYPISRCKPLQFVYQNLVPRLPPNFVADVAFVPSGEARQDGRWVLVEVNPFGRQTSGCLFSWVMDAGVLMEGPDEYSCELRLSPNERLRVHSS